MRSVLVGFLVLLVVSVDSGGAQQRTQCVTGRAQGFISIRDDPEYLVGTIPSTFNASPIYFSRRYNCRRRSASVRRVDLGVYDVRFPGLANRTPIATAISQEGVSASVQPFPNAVYRVALRGPLTSGDGGALVRRDVPFSVVIF